MESADTSEIYDVNLIPSYDIRTLKPSGYSCGFQAVPVVPFPGHIRLLEDKIHIYRHFIS